MRDIERSRMMAPHAGEGGRIMRRLRRELRGRRQPGRDRQRYPIEEVAASDCVRHADLLVTN
jgi:hypothetical protein